MAHNKTRPVRAATLSFALLVSLCGVGVLQTTVRDVTDFVSVSDVTGTNLRSASTRLRSLQDVNLRYRLPTSYTGVKEGLNAGCTLLMEAAMHGEVAAVMSVIQSGARLEEKDDHGWTALRYAVRHERFDAVKLLLKLGADIDSTSITGRTALMSAAGDAGQGSLLMCKLLVQGGADVCKRDTKGRTMFDWAELRGSTDTGELRTFVARSNAECSTDYLLQAASAVSTAPSGKSSDFTRG